MVIIKLKDILLNEDIPSDVKDAFGNIAFGQNTAISILQGTNKNEPNTKFEAELISSLKNWVSFSSDKTAKELYAKKELLKKASDYFPSILKPTTPNGTQIYRGLSRTMFSDEDFEKMKPDDFESPLIFGGKKYYKYIHPINYTPHREIQSWTVKLNIAKKFMSMGDYILMSKQNNEYMFSQKLMHTLFGENEGEILHFGKKYSDDIFALVSDDVYNDIITRHGNFKFPQTKDAVKEVVDSFGIKDYTINDDLTVDTNWDVDLTSKSLRYIPVQFGKVKGSFRCYSNRLISLKGSPREVGGTFDCSFNKLSSLEFGPEKVGGFFSCENNKLITLKGSPREINSSFDCTKNSLTSLEYGPEKVSGGFYCSDNPLTSLIGAPKEVGGEFVCLSAHYKPLDDSSKKWAKDNIKAKRFRW